MLAWFEAQGKKRPRSPNPDASENEGNPQSKSALTGTRYEGMS